MTISCMVYGWPLFNLLWSPFIHGEYTSSLHFTLRLEFCITRNSIYKNETLCIAILLLWRKALRRDYIGGINHITKGSLHIQPASTHRPPTPSQYFPQIFKYLLISPRLLLPRSICSLKSMLIFVRHSQNENMLRFIEKTTI